MVVLEGEEIDGGHSGQEMFWKVRRLRGYLTVRILREGEWFWKSGMILGAEQIEGGQGWLFWYGYGG
jgi:hypothetical protein